MRDREFLVLPRFDTTPSRLPLDADEVLMNNVDANLLGDADFLFA